MKLDETLIDGHTLVPNMGALATPFDPCNIKAKTRKIWGARVGLLLRRMINMHVTRPGQVIVLCHSVIIRLSRGVAE